MKIAPTLEGGLRIDPESDLDWQILRMISADANQHETDLADRLGGMVRDERIAEDWMECVVPDLREAFCDDLFQIQAAIEAAAAFHSDGAHSIWISKEDAFAWYSALNQARLALEEMYRFKNEPDIDSENAPSPRQQAFLRSQFYCALQSLILEHAL
jgi:hypothetical protein